MTSISGKLTFVHRRLWRDDGIYRASLLLGPAPLIGVALAFALWAGAQRSAAETTGAHPAPPPWAVRHSNVWSASDGRPHILQPNAPVPPNSSGGALAGYRPGWEVSIHPVSWTNSMDVDVKPAPLSGFAMEGSRIDMERLLAEGPKNQLFAGIGAALLVARTAGIYTLTARLDRPAGRSANCLSRMAFGQHRLFSNLDLDVVNDVSKTFAPMRFELRPGLYWLRWAFGCWEGQRASQTGSLTILVGHPGAPEAQAGDPEDFIRPAASD